MGTIRLVVFDLDGTPRATMVAGDPSPVMDDFPPEDQARLFHDNAWRIYRIGT